MNDYYTREPTSGYEVTFCTEDKATYEAVKKFCRQMSGELMPNEPKYEARPRASWIEKQVDNAEDLSTDMWQSARCSACGY